MPDRFIAYFLKSARLAAVIILLIITPSAVLAQKAPESAEEAYEKALVFQKQSPSDYAQAIPLFEKAAEQGHAKAQSILGLYYIAGLGVARDYEKALSWLTKAATQGDAEAQSTLALMYYEGMGVKQNYEKAVSWLTKAATQGDAEAQTTLALFYNKGIGVPKDISTAYMWATISYNKGIIMDAEEMLSQLAASMTKEQIAEAKDRAFKCLASNYKSCD